MSEKRWTLTLNKYQRDNLLWLINAVGWPYTPGKVESIGPFGLANTGDWIGEIGWMLKDDDDMLPVLDEADRPNRSLEELRRLVESLWKRR
jgi:hypothetical protein